VVNNIVEQMETTVDDNETGWCKMEKNCTEVNMSNSSYNFDSLSYNDISEPSMSNFTLSLCPWPQCDDSPDCRCVVGVPGARITLEGVPYPDMTARIVSIGAFIVTVHPSLFTRHCSPVTEQTDALHAQIAALAADLQAAKLIQPHHGGGDQGSLLQRSMRLEVPKFNGTEPKRFNLEGATAEWFRWMSRNKLITSWEGFLESVRNRFGPCKYENPQGSLSKLLQTGTVAQYQSEFEKLMNRVTDISENLLILFYILGLKPTLQRELLVSKPTSLGEAFSLARVIEARLEDQSPTSTIAKRHDIITFVQTNNPTHSQVIATSSNSGKPPLLPTPTESTTPTNTTPLAIKWISPEERQERLNKGLCFNCDSKWMRGYKCLGKFMLHMAEEDDNQGREIPVDPTYYLEDKMGQVKLRMELIKKEKTRITTYHKRKLGILKKASEFSILCDVDTIMIITPPNSNEPEENDSKARLEFMKRSMNINYPYMLNIGNKPKMIHFPGLGLGNPNPELNDVQLMKPRQVMNHWFCNDAPSTSYMPVRHEPVAGYGYQGLVYDNNLNTFLSFQLPHLVQGGVLSEFVPQELESQVNNGGAGDYEIDYRRGRIMG
ncbi:retrotransposon-related protein, partial [Tanacetum coccineum]